MEQGSGNRQLVAALMLRRTKTEFKTLENDNFIKCKDLQAQHKSETQYCC